MIDTCFVVRNREVGVIFEIPTMMQRGTIFVLEHPLYLSPPKITSPAVLVFTTRVSTLNLYLLVDLASGDLRF